MSDRAGLGSEDNRERRIDIRYLVKYLERHTRRPSGPILFHHSPRTTWTRCGTPSRQSGKSG